MFIDCQENKMTVFYLIHTKLLMEYLIVHVKIGDLESEVLCLPLFFAGLGPVFNLNRLVQFGLDFQAC